MGVDGDKAESVVNLTGNRQAVLWTANTFLLVGTALLWRVISKLVGASRRPFMSRDFCHVKIRLSIDNACKTSVCRVFLQLSA